MSLETILAITLAIAVALNVVLAIVVLLVRRRATRTAPNREMVAATKSRAGGAARRGTIEGLDPQASPNPAAPNHASLNIADARPLPSAVARAASAGPRVVEGAARGPVVLPRDDFEPPYVPPRGTGLDPGRDLVDPLTGLDGPLAWEQHLRDEASRIARYARPAAVVVAELAGVRRLEERFGEEQARPLVSAVAEVFRREARRCDRVARVGRVRYAVLLPETTEEQALNYVDRVRAAANRWLEEGGVAVRLSVGIASPGPSGRLDMALRVAEARMYADARASSGPSAPD